MLQQSVANCVLLKTPQHMEPQLQKQKPQQLPINGIIIIITKLHFYHHHH